MVQHDDVARNFGQLDEGFVERRNVDERDQRVFEFFEGERVVVRPRDVATLGTPRTSH
jgi:hypothetical protein